MKKNKNLECPFCGQKIEKKLPKGLQVKEIIRVADKLVKEKYPGKYTVC